MVVLMPTGGRVQLHDALARVSQKSASIIASSKFQMLQGHSKDQHCCKHSKSNKKAMDNADVYMRATCRISYRTCPEITEIGVNILIANSEKTRHR
jgi:hypothetical protein